MSAGTPRTKFRLVTLFTKQLVRTSWEGPLRFAMIATNNKFPIPEQYGITSVPSAVPSRPCLSNASNRQIIKPDAARNSAR